MGASKIKVIRDPRLSMFSENLAPSTREIKKKIEKCMNLK